MAVNINDPSEVKQYLNEKFGEMHVLANSGQIDAANALLDEVVAEIVPDEDVDNG